MPLKPHGSIRGCTILKDENRLELKKLSDNEERTVHIKTATILSVGMVAVA